MKTFLKNLSAGPLALCAVILTILARCRYHASVFLPGGDIMLLPSDSHYYVRFAQLQLAAWPHFVKQDPFVNFPAVAEIYWPPFHAWIVAGAIAGGKWLGLAPEAAAALVGPIVAALECLLLTLLAWRWLGNRVALILALGYSLLPALVESGAIGNADHHVHESFVCVLAALCLGRTLASGSPRAALATGLAIALGRLLSTSTFLVGPILALAVLAAASRADSKTARIMAGSALIIGVTGAGLLLIGAWLWGGLTSLDYERLSLFHSMIVLAAFGGAAGLAAVRSGDRRGWLLILAGSVLAILPGQTVISGLGHLGRVDPLLAIIRESRPLWRHPGWAIDLLSSAWLLLPWASAALIQQSLCRPQRLRPQTLSRWPVITALLIWGLMAATQARFIQPFAGAAVLAIALVAGELGHISNRARRRFCLGLTILAGVFLLPSLAPAPFEAPPTLVAKTKPALLWLRQHTPSPLASTPAGHDQNLFSATARPSYGVVATYHLGHFLSLWAERPSIAAPFSLTPWHVAGIERAYAVLAADGDDAGFQLARATGARYILVYPVSNLLGHPDRDPQKSLAGWLLQSGGLGGRAGFSSGHFRLLFNSTEKLGPSQTDRPYCRILEVVEGARLTGTISTGPITIMARTTIDIGGVAMSYERSLALASAGRFELVLAQPGNYEIFIGPKRLTTPVSETAILTGQIIDVAPLGLQP